MDAEVDLQPFSLIVGANGSGKSNLLKFFAAISLEVEPSSGAGRVAYTLKAGWIRHQNAANERSSYSVTLDGREVIGTQEAGKTRLVVGDRLLPWQGEQLPIFNIDPDKVSAVEITVPNPVIKANGEGTTQVLDTLKNGDREDLFDQIELNFRRYVPEVEKLSLRTIEQGKKQIQVRERGLKTPVPATELSEGTRLILCLLTILHQENPPPMILLEDVDRGLHPRLFEFVAPLMRDIAESHKINILATTHNPFLVNCFQDFKNAVIIVEKKDGASTLTTLDKKLEGLDYETVDPEDMPLGTLWYTGLIGGTPKTPEVEAVR
jgi:predicted ATPase